MLRRRKMSAPKGEPIVNRGRRPWDGWPDEEVTLEKRRLNEGLRNLWERNEVTESDRHRLISDIVGEPL